ncbi:hypothetical protein MMC28_002002, partial [Mycoblastus sanguinarius]|nr:hypothetical protein [Mycoblastus sanguinarius]
MAPGKRKRFDTPPFSSDPPEGAEQPTPKRIRVKELDYIGKTRQEIREETGVPERTQVRIVNEGSHRPGRKRNGTPCKLDVDTVAKMIKSLHGHYDKRVLPWDEFTLKWRTPEHPPLVMGPPLSGDT